MRKVFQRLEQRGLVTLKTSLVLPDLSPSDTRLHLASGRQSPQRKSAGMEAPFAMAGKAAAYRHRFSDCKSRRGNGRPDWGTAAQEN